MGFQPLREGRQALALHAALPIAGGCLLLLPDVSAEKLARLVSLGVALPLTDDTKDEFKTTTMTQFSSVQLSTHR